jgi:tetratricopeptide (TPR) repeat protein
MELTNFNGTNPISGFLNLSYDYCIRGTFMADEGNLEGALENFTKAIETNPSNDVAYFNRATVKIDLGDIEGARNDFLNFDIIRAK